MGGIYVVQGQLHLRLMARGAARLAAALVGLKLNAPPKHQGRSVCCDSMHGGARFGRVILMTIIGEAMDTLVPREQRVQERSR